jgi:EmrB/QacA subfamily drug resistance transporter
MGGYMVQSTKIKPQAKNRKWAVLSVICFGLFMILLDVTIVNIALPSIMTNFKVSLSSIEWILNVYVLVFASLLLTLGKLGDLFGRKRFFAIGLVVFTLASLGCSLAPNLPILLISRGVQALGGAAMLPATLSILNVEFDKSQRGLALGIWGAVAGAANALGPIIGGALVDAISWRWVFVINIPIGIIVLIFTFLIVRESVDNKSDRHIDIPGVLVISAALFCLTFALVEGQKYGWTSVTILALFAVALVGLVAFVLMELKIKNPLVQLRLFKNRSFSAGNIVGLVINFGLIGIVFLLVLYLQIVLKLSALTAGLWILPFPLAIILVAPFAGRLTDKIGGRWILFSGTLITALGFFLLSDLSGVTHWTHVLLPLIVCGLGVGTVMAPVTTVIMASTPVEKSGIGAGILSTTRQVGAVMGLSVLGAVLQNRLVSNVTQALSQIPLNQGVKDNILAGVASGNLSIGSSSSTAQLPPAVVAQMTELFKTQFAHSLQTAMYVGIIVILLGSVASLFIAGNIKKSKTPIEPPVGRKNI